jgi:hypothetical protein
MFDSPILDAAIGLVFLFLIYSLLASSINEAIATFWGMRARMLRKSIIEGMLTQNSWKSIPESIGVGIVGFLYDIKNLFVKRDYSKRNHLGWRFYQSPIIRNFGENSVYPFPSYISPSDFAQTLRKILIDIANTDEFKNQFPDFENYTDAKKISILLENLASILPTAIISPENKNGILDISTLSILQGHFTDAKGDMKDFENRLENWFDNHMNRVSGWYKRQIHYFLFLIGFSLAICLKIDAIRIARHLLKDDKARAQLVEMAIAASNNPQYNASSTSANDSLDALEESKRIFNDGYSIVKKDMDGAKLLMALGWEHFGNKDSIYIQQLKSSNFYFYFDTLSDFKTSFQNLRKHYFEFDSAAVSQEVQNIVFEEQKEIQAKLYQIEDSIIMFESKVNKGLFSIRDSLAIICFHKDSTILAQLLLQKQISIPKIVNERIDELTVLKIIATRPLFYKIKYAFWYMWNRSFAFLGFLITAFGISLGAPFWYDLLNKLVRLRAGGKKEENESAQSPNTIVINNGINSEKIPG